MFYDSPHMVNIGGCESNYIQYKIGGGVLRGRVTPADTGTMQINLDAHGKEVARLDLDMETLYDNVTYARILYENEGVRPWVCKNMVASI